MGSLQQVLANLRGRATHVDFVGTLMNVREVLVNTAMQGC